MLLVACARDLEHTLLESYILGVLSVRQWVGFAILYTHALYRIAIRRRMNDRIHKSMLLLLQVSS